MTQRRPLIIPVENQVRELDPKLLLACIAARRGFTSILGNLREIDLRIASFPPSLYLCKSMTARNLGVFRILRRLGHEIASWDEEALVHLPDEIYYSRRLDPASLHCLSHLFAWGEENVRLWRQYPQLPGALPIHLTGNPRCDLLRPELLPFYREEVDEIRSEHAPFLLVNGNFNHVNAFYAQQNLFFQRTGGSASRLGKAGVGMPQGFAERLRDQKEAVFQAFQKLLPTLDRAFPRHTIVVRPHPTESLDVYRSIAASCARVRVTNAGNVVPWLLGASALVHNGCTTGVEAFAIGVPAISYRPRVDPQIDDGFYGLPHGLSHQCFDLDALIDLLKDVTTGKLGAPTGPERQALLDRHVTGLAGRSASERIVAVVEALGEDRGSPGPSLPDAAVGHAWANARRLVKRVRDRIPYYWKHASFYRHRYPALSVEQVREKLRRFERLLGEAEPVRVEDLGGGIFRVSGSEGARP